MLQLEVMSMIGNVVAGTSVSQIDAMPREDLCRMPGH